MLNVTNGYILVVLIIYIQIKVPYLLIIYVLFYRMHYVYSLKAQNKIGNEGAILLNSSSTYTKFKSFWRECYVCGSILHRL